MHPGVFVTGCHGKIYNYNVDLFNFIYIRYIEMFIFLPCYDDDNIDGNVGNLNIGYLFLDSSNPKC